MWKIIMLLILIGIALYFFIAKPGYTSKEREEYVDGGYTQSRYVEVHHSLTRFGFVPLVLALLFFAMNSITQVHAKEVGVGVQFGKPVAEYDAGLHLKPFWYSVTKINGTVYTDSYGTTGAENKAIPVRLGDGNPAWASVTMRWHINPDAVDYIYATYRSNDPAGQLRDAVVDTQLQAVVNNVFSTFNPTSVVQNINVKNPLDAVKQLNFSPPYSEMATQINDQMNQAVKDADGLPLIVIDKVTVSGIAYSSGTENRIASLTQQAAQTQRNVLLQTTNQALSTANGKLKNSLSGEDGVRVLVQQCLQDLAEGKFVPPAGFSCWPGSGSGVIVPSASK
jgi:hypothetical protein